MNWEENYRVSVLWEVCLLYSSLSIVRAICLKDFVSWDERSTTESKDEQLI